MNVRFDPISMLAHRKRNRQQTWTRPDIKFPFINTSQYLADDHKAATYYNDF